MVVLIFENHNLIRGQSWGIDSLKSWFDDRHI